MLGPADKVYKGVAVDKPVDGTTVLEEVVLVEGIGVPSNRLDDVEAIGCYEQRTVYWSLLSYHECSIVTHCAGRN